MIEVQEELLKWYQKEKRNLPWRSDKEPYHVWVSEIMLQQTRIEAVLPYYRRFMEELPTITDLAYCPEEKLLKLWEGLGYYNRVRNLQKAAKIVVEEYHSAFPQTMPEILSLPGIGEYTASAISSICFNKKEAAVDGNVLRVFARVHNDFRNIEDSKVKKEIRNTIQKHLPQEAGKFNQAMMELGETICLPNGEPKCANCPLQKKCLSYQKGTCSHLPIREKKKSTKEEKRTVYLLIYQGKVAIRKREEDALLHNLWEFPNQEGHQNKKEAESFWKEQGYVLSKIEKGPSYTHVFSHKKWNMISYFIEISNHPNNSYQWLTKEDLEKNYAIPTAFKPFQKELERKENNL